MIDLPLTESTTDTAAFMALLERQHESKLDAVVPAVAVRATTDRTIEVDGLSVFDGAVSLQPLDAMVGHLAEKLGIPVAYLRRMLEHRPDLWAANVNGWLQGNRAITPPQAHDDRRFLLRSFTDPGTNEGYGRALLSDTFGIIDHLDVVTAVLDALRQEGTEVELRRCDLTERRLRVRFSAPGIAVAAPILLRDYVSPYTGESGNDLPVVEAGLDLHNGETGGSRFLLNAFIRVRICDNGLTMNAYGHALSRVHLGSRMPEGVVHWSEETRQRQLELVMSQARDAVRSFLTPEYVAEAVRLLEKDATVPLDNYEQTIELVSTRLHYTDEQRAGILQHFIQGRQLTAGGVMQAVTSWAQQIDNPDVAIDFEGTAVQAMQVAAAAAR